MNPTDWTSEKPTTPGLYHWCDGVTDNVRLYRVWASADDRSLLCDYIEGTTYNRGPWRVSAQSGFWSPVPIPAPYIKPVPPKVDMEIWEATAHDGSYRLLHVYQHGFIAFDYLGARKATCDMKASECGYTNLRRVDG